MQGIVYNIITTKIDFSLGALLSSRASEDFMTGICTGVAAVPNGFASAEDPMPSDDERAPARAAGWSDAHLGTRHGECRKARDLIRCSNSDSRGRSRPPLDPVCTSCGTIGADARPNWAERQERPTLTGNQWRGAR
jgi:hypothetical protein